MDGVDLCMDGIGLCMEWIGLCMDGIGNGADGSVLAFVSCHVSPGMWHVAWVSGAGQGRNRQARCVTLANSARLLTWVLCSGLQEPPAAPCRSASESKLGRHRQRHEQQGGRGEAQVEKRWGVGHKTGDHASQARRRRGPGGPRGLPGRAGGRWTGVPGPCSRVRWRPRAPKTLPSSQDAYGLRDSC